MQKEMDYYSIDVRDLIIAVGVKYGDQARIRACKRVKAGKDYTERMLDFYNDCWKDRINPVFYYSNTL